MGLSGNKGEWSEVYTLLKLLADGTMYAGDENSNAIAELFYPIVLILRKEIAENLNYRPGEQYVSIEKPDGEVVARVLTSEFAEEASNLLVHIRNGKNSFQVPSVQDFLSKIKVHQLKADSNDKTDIRIILHDPRTCIQSELGFSIKSHIGGDSTLLNASGSTNFIFRVTGASMEKAEIASVNAIETRSKILDRIVKIGQGGRQLQFERIENPTFEDNLRMLDGDLPRLLAEMLTINTKQNLSNFSDLAKPVGIALFGDRDDPERAEEITRYKLKHLLVSVALGLMPSKPWDGLYEANGGYIIVKESGDIVAYHFYDRNRFSDYLFNCAYLERASSSRHKYGSLYRDRDGQVKFKLNLQIRLRS